jgi:Putative cyclase
MTTDERIQQAAKKYRNWGKWGKDDQLGTLNYITPEKIIQAARLVRAGRVISLALPYDSAGPQTGAWGRVNPIHTFVLTGTDAAAGVQPFPHGIGAADDAVTMFLQCGTQWDALAHIFDYGKMWNGQDAARVSARGAEVNGIEKMAEKIVSRGVLLDIARFKGLEALVPGYPVTEQDLVGCAAAEEVKIGRGASCWFARDNLVTARKTDGARLPPATLRDFPSAPRTGSTAPRSPASRATRGGSKCGPTSCPTLFNRSIR